MLKVPRELFVPEAYRDEAYDDTPLPIGYGQTISAPSIVAYMIELLDPEPGMKVLEVGAGSGYAAAVLAEIVAPEDAPENKRGIVYAIERIPELAEFARRNLEKAGYSDRVIVIVGDGTKGYSEEAPYDRILVSAAAPRVPEPLLEQLSRGGKMVIPLGDLWAQSLYVIVKDLNGQIRRIRDIDVIFVPLIGEHGWRE
jgi:protein-L-isoaspartate(D-aspartate) O-methyltransferase